MGNFRLEDKISSPPRSSAGCAATRPWHVHWLYLPHYPTAPLPTYTSSWQSKFKSPSLSPYIIERFATFPSQSPLRAASFDLYRGAGGLAINAHTPRYFHQSDGSPKAVFAHFRVPNKYQSTFPNQTRPIQLQFRVFYRWYLQPVSSTIISHFTTTSTVCFAWKISF